MNQFFSRYSNFLVATMIATLSISFSLMSCQSKDRQQQESKVEIPGPTLTLVEKWETDTSLTTAESVILDDEAGLIYVACIGAVPPDAKDGDGFIAQIAIYGNVVKEKWITGLNGPKGMGIYEDTLYIADITDVVKVARITGEILDRVNIEGSIFLNDITIDEGGVVYISDTRANRIYKLENGNTEVWLDDSEMGGPNGLYAEADRIMVATFGAGNFGSVDRTSKQFDDQSAKIPSGDGIVKIDDGYLVSNWNGEVYHVNADWEQTLILDTKGIEVNAADIAIVPAKNMLLVPTFFKNSVVAYEIQKSISH
ncbi:MAG: gluconolaconase [Saprospiraceae bacterium]|nr:gluconolaconase [Saprospiraceae bacterium]